MVTCRPIIHAAVWIVKPSQYNSLCNGGCIIIKSNWSFRIYIFIYLLLHSTIHKPCTMYHHNKHWTVWTIEIRKQSWYGYVGNQCHSLHACIHTHEASTPNSPEIRRLQSLPLMDYRADYSSKLHPSPTHLTPYSTLYLSPYRNTTAHSWTHIWAHYPTYTVVQAVHIHYSTNPSTQHGARKTPISIEAASQINWNKL